MSQRNAPSPGKGMAPSRRRTLAGIVLAGITALAANSLWGQRNDTSKNKDFSVAVQGPDTDAGLIVSARATAKEVGLPIYPGSRPYKEQDKDDFPVELELKKGFGHGGLPDRDKLKELYPFTRNAVPRPR